MKYLTSILNFSRAPKCVFSNNDTKALFLRDNHSCLFFIYLDITIMWGRTSNVLTFSTMKWRNQLPFWAAVYVPSVCLLTMVHNLSLCNNHLSLFCISQQYNHLRTNNQLINLLYNDVKDFTSILSFCICPKCVSSNNYTKPLFLRDNHCCLFFIYLGITIIWVQACNLLTFSPKMWRT